MTHPHPHPHHELTDGHDPAPEPQRASILIAEDEDDLRETLTRMLGREWHVEAVPDGVQALAATRSYLPDLVVTDIRMPGIGGFELIDELRAWEATRDIPVIVLSARGGTEAVADGLARGADDYLAKPFSRQELVMRIRLHLERSRAARDLKQIATERERLLRSLALLLDQAPDAMITVDESGTIQRANDRAVNLLGYTSAELIGMDVEQLVPSGLHDRHRSHRAGYSHTPLPRVMGSASELACVHKDGTEFPVEISLSPIDTGTGLLISAAIRDVTERSRMDAERRHDVEAREREALLRSEEYQRALLHYQQIVRHRIANPLQVIEGMATTLQERTDVDHVTRDYMVEAIVEAARSLKQASLFDPVIQDSVERGLNPRPVSVVSDNAVGAR